MQQAAVYLDKIVESVWIPTYFLETGVKGKLEHFDGILCASGAPYNSATGVVHGLQYVREADVPFLGIGSGFQYAMLEYGKNVLQIKCLKSMFFDPCADELFCSEDNGTYEIHLEENNTVKELYETDMVEEICQCGWYLTEDFQNQLVEQHMHIEGVDEQGHARIIKLEGLKYYIATLSEPQMHSTYEVPHPLIKGFVEQMKLNR